MKLDIKRFWDLVRHHSQNCVYISTFLRLLQKSFDFSYLAIFLLSLDWQVICLFNIFFHLIFLYVLSFQSYLNNSSWSRFFFYWFFYWTYCFQCSRWKDMYKAMKETFNSEILAFAHKKTKLQKFHVLLCLNFSIEPNDILGWFRNFVPYLCTIASCGESELNWNYRNIQKQ